MFVCLHDLMARKSVYVCVCESVLAQHRCRPHYHTATFASQRGDRTCGIFCQVLTVRICVFHVQPKFCNGLFLVHVKIASSYEKWVEIPLCVMKSQQEQILRKNPCDYLFVIQLTTSFGQYKNYWQTLFSTDFRKL